MSNIFEGIDFSAFDQVEKNQNLAQVKQDHVGGQIELALAEVVEDPDQPRRFFGQIELDELALSIKKRGVVQPIIVRPKNEDGKYVIVMGARRFRASQLAGAKKIPAVIRVKPSDGYDQMIENIQRENLLHTDIARFIEQEMAKGQKPSDIALLLCKPRPWVSLYVGFSQMHERIRKRVEEFGIRAAYELQKAIEIDKTATLAYLANTESISQREAMAFARGLKKDAPSEVEGEVSDISEADSSAIATGDASVSIGVNVSSRELPKEEPRLTPLSTQKRISFPVAIIVKIGERAGRLLVDRVARKGSQFGVVSFDNGAQIEEVALADIKLLEMIIIE